MLLCALVTGCASQTFRVSTRPGELTRIPAPTQGPVFVLALAGVPPTWTSDEAFKRLVQLATALGEAGWIVLAPWEYAGGGFTRDAQPDADAVLQLEALGVDPSRLWVLAVTLRESTASQTTDLATGDDGVTAYRHRRQVGLDLALHDPRLGKVLARVAVQVDQDPFAQGADEIDPLPALSAAFPAAAEALTDALAAHGIAPNGLSELDASLRFNPKRVVTFELPGLPSLASRLGGLSPTDQMALKVTHFQFFDRDVDVARIEQLERWPAGMVVDDPGPLARWSVRRGDVLVAANGVAIEGPHAVLRTLALADLATRLVVVRDGAEVVLMPRKARPRD